MALPASLPTLAVTGNFVSAGGAAQSGAVLFTPSSEILDAAGVTVIPAVPVTAALSGGSFATVLPCTDTAGLVPLNWGFNCTVAVAGAQQTFFTWLPKALGGTAGTVDITALAPVTATPAPSGVYYLPNATSPPSAGPSGGGGFLFVNNGALYWLGPSGSPVEIAPA